MTTQLVWRTNAWALFWFHSMLLRSPETNRSFLENWHDSCLSSEYLIILFPVLSAHLFISLSSSVAQFHLIPLGSTWFHCALWSAFGLSRKLLNSRTLSLLLSPSSFHSTSPSLLHLCLTLSKTQHQKPFLPNADATKEVNSPAAHRDIWHGVGATKAWLHSSQWSKSFAVVEKSLNSTEIFHLDDKTNAQRWQSDTN